eukprot:1160545-Pelagomonas_calceolata.AAC.9
MAKSTVQRARQHAAMYRRVHRLKLQLTAFVNRQVHDKHAQYVNMSRWQTSQLDKNSDAGNF